MKKMTRVSLNHYCKLVLRGFLFLNAIYLYITQWHGNHNAPFGHETDSLFLMIVWVFGIAEIISRFFPSNIESMGCQKVFEKNYYPTGVDTTDFKLDTWKSTFTVAGVWLALNGLFGWLYLTHKVDTGFMFLLCLFYSVCDMICILFFCPFQSWFMKNRCCTTCRIYNWDFPMMWTPMIFVGGWYGLSLLGLALVLLARWEYVVRKYPERFSITTNACLNCLHCPEKLCHHKKQLRSLWKRIKPKF